MRGIPATPIEFWDRQRKRPPFQGLHFIEILELFSGPHGVCLLLNTTVIDSPILNRSGDRPRLVRSGQAGDCSLRKCSDHILCATAAKTRTGQEFFHAAMMAQAGKPAGRSRDNRASRRTNAPRTVGLSIQTGERRAQQRYHRLAEGGRHVPRAAVGGNHQPAAPQACLGGRQSQRLIGQREDARALRPRRRFRGRSRPRPAHRPPTRRGPARRRSAGPASRNAPAASVWPRRRPRCYSRR